VTDLDGTYVLDDKSMHELNRVWLTACYGRGCELVFSTGRSLSSFKELTQTRPLMRPDYIVAAVGTEVYKSLHAKNDYELDEEWRRIVGVGWDRKAVEAMTQRVVGLKLQPASEQRDYKISFMADAALVAQLKTDLERARESLHLKVMFIWSGSGKSRFVDCVPLGGGKYHALQFLRKKMNFAESRTIVAGDSGNDIGLFQGEEYGVAVGNSQQELLDCLKDLNQRERHHLAIQKGPTGILEGLGHFGFL